MVWVRSSRKSLSIRFPNNSRSGEHSAPCRLPTELIHWKKSRFGGPSLVFCPNKNSPIFLPYAEYVSDLKRLPSHQRSSSSRSTAEDATRCLKFQRDVGPSGWDLCNTSPHTPLTVILLYQLLLSKVGLIKQTLYIPSVHAFICTAPYIWWTVSDDDLPLTETASQPSSAIEILCCFLHLLEVFAVKEKCLICILHVFLCAMELIIIWMIHTPQKAANEL